MEYWLNFPARGLRLALLATEREHERTFGSSWMQESLFVCWNLPAFLPVVVFLFFIVVLLVFLLLLPLIFLLFILLTLFFVVVVYVAVPHCVLLMILFIVVALLSLSIPVVCYCWLIKIGWFSCCSCCLFCWRYCFFFFSFWKIKRSCLKRVFSV